MGNYTEINDINRTRKKNPQKNPQKNPKKNSKEKLSSNDRKALKQRRKTQRIKNIHKIFFIICVMLSVYMIIGIIHKNKTFSIIEPNRIIENASENQLVKPKIYTSDECQKKLAKLAETSADYQKIYNNIHAYPQELLAALCSNPELLEFTLGYLNKDNNQTGGLTQEELKEKYPLLMQWDRRWGYVSYGDSCIGLDGCAPTCMSMVILALSHNEQATPDAVATYEQKAGYYLKGVGTSWSFMTEGASHFGIKGNELSLSKSTVFSELQNGHPIICSMKPGDFTSQGHFIVLIGVQDGKIIVNDPNSKERSRVLWDYDVLNGQIKNLWGYKK